MRKCELERITMTANGVFMDVTGAGNADAVDDMEGISTALKPSLCRAWRKLSSDPDKKVGSDWWKVDRAAFLVTLVNVGGSAPSPEVEAPSDPLRDSHGGAGP